MTNRRILADPGGDGPGNESCGDAFLDPGEQCDDGNTAGGDGCDADQSLDYTAGTLLCGAGCAYDESGCTGLVSYFHDDLEDQPTTLSQWNEISIDLSAYAGQVIQLAFALYSDGSGTYPGMYIDNVMILD